MEMEINDINNKIFTKLYLKLKEEKKFHKISFSSKKETKCEYLPDIKKYSNSNQNMLFSRKTIWKPPTPFSTNPLFLSNFSMTSLFIQLSKTRNPPKFKGEKTMLTFAYR